MLELADIEDQLIQGDVVEVLKTIPDGVFDFGFTSPPYNLKNSTGNGMKEHRVGKWDTMAMGIICHMMNTWYGRGRCLPKSCGL